MLPFVTAVFTSLCLWDSLMQHVWVFTFYGWILFVWIYHTLFFSSSVNGLLDCLHFRVIMNNTTMNTLVQIFVWRSVFNSLGYIPRRTIDPSYANSLFNYLRNIQFSKVTAQFLFLQTTQRSSNFFTSLSTFVVVYLFNIAILVCVKWYSIKVLICISQWLTILSIFSYEFWLFVYLLEEVLLTSFFHLLLGYVPVFEHCRSSICILNTGPFWGIWFANIFSLFIGCFNTSFMEVIPLF